MPPAVLDAVLWQLGEAQRKPVAERFVPPVALDAMQAQPGGAQGKPLAEPSQQARALGVACSTVGLMDAPCCPLSQPGKPLPSMSGPMQGVAAEQLAARKTSTKL